MRAVTSATDSPSPTDNFVRVLDQFAALGSYSSDATGVGGYRVLSSQRASQRQTFRTSLPAPTLAKRAGTRVRWTGSLSVLFIGGLGLAVLAGPANCPCTSPYIVAEQSSLERLGYVQNARMITEHEFEATAAADLPPLSATALVEPEREVSGVSPISTSALEPLRDVPTVKSDDVPATSAGRLPVKVEEVADARPEPVRLATASNIETDVPPSLPAIDVATPPASDATANDNESGPVAKGRSAKKRLTRAYRTPTTLRGKSKKSLAEPPQRSPKWAQQMFVTPWQTKAFSYTQ
ncbi:MAG: hypothetical protein ABI457_06410 [Hyphomicrobium sp.]|jgi:hypothetical protein